MKHTAFLTGQGGYNSLYSMVPPKENEEDQNILESSMGALLS